MRRVLVGAVVCAILASGAQVARSEPITWEPYTYKTRTGTSITEGERGRLRVPESHRNPDGPKIELDFIRFRCTSEAPGPPIVWLAGGPGDFGSDDIEGPYLELVRAFQTVADVIAQTWKLPSMTESHFAELSRLRETAPRRTISFR
jgi:hypothetical protein